MKTTKHFIYIALAFVFSACGSDFLDRVPQGELVTSQLQTPEGVEGLLISAYGLMNGNISGTWGNYASAPSQWLIGEVGADNAHKGSNNGDQPNMNQIELYQVTSTNDNLEVMWNRYYEGIARCNNVLRMVKMVQEGSGQKLTDARALEIQAEARMLRAHYYFFLRRVFVNIPYVDETMTTAEAALVKNDTDVFPKIEEDLKFAIANLTGKPKGDAGRVDKLAAQAYLGKVYLYEKKPAEALPLFTTVIAAKPLITTIPFTDNFDVTKENGPESIFTAQNAINPDGSGDNANVGDMLGGFYGSAPVNCCGFFQPTFDLVNAYKVDAVTGLPFLDNSYRTNPIKSDFGLSGDAKTNYKVDKTVVVDPRLDYTVGRRGVPYRDWGLMAGDAWIRDPAYAGPFVGVKQMIEQAQFAGQAVKGALQITGLNINIIRLADVYLMAAECNVPGNLPEAMRLVNLVRARAALLPGKQIDGGLAAVYKVGQYTSFPTADYANNAIRFERRLELALEGHRFYDLVRWGVAKTVLESYSTFEGGLLSAYKGLVFDAKDAYFPIPQQQIDRSQGALTQNN